MSVALLRLSSHSTEAPSSMWGTRKAEAGDKAYELKQWAPSPSLLESFLSPFTFRVRGKSLESA